MRELTGREKLRCAWLGLLVGLGALFIFVLQNALRVRASLLRAHMGEPDAQFRAGMVAFGIYGVFALVGWLLVGVPSVLAIPARRVRSFSWLAAGLVGATVGVVALFVDFLLLAGGRVQAGWARNTGPLWAYAAGVGAVAFAVYTALLRRQTRAKDAAAAPGNESA